MERKLTAILCADVHGYSRLMGDDEEATLRTLSTYRKIIDSLIESYRGRFVNSAGDSVLAEFASVVNAVQCAIDIQSAFKAENAKLPADRRMEFRIGVNLGDVMVEGEQIYGDGVNVAARLESLAEPGSICISGTVHEQIRDKLALGYVDLGDQQVKNIARPVRVYRVLLEPGDATPTKTPRVALKYRRHGVFSIAAIAIIIATILFAQHVSLKPPHNHALIPPEERPAIPLPNKPSIAVLPFANLSGDSQQNYFSDGITDDLITGLSRLSGLFVIDRSSTFSYKNKVPKIKDVGRELAVKYVLEGSARKEADQIRINVQLVEADTGSQLWAKRYDEPFRDVFKIQDDIVESLVTTLNVQLPLLQEGYLIPQRTSNLEAYDWFLHGFEYSLESTPDGFVKARKMFERAIKLDPDYPDPYTALSFSYFAGYVWQWDRDPDAWDHAARLANKAISLNDLDAYPYVVLGWIDAFKAERDNALANGQRALSLAPNSALVYNMLAQSNLALDGNPMLEIDYARKAMHLDPRHAAGYWNDVGYAYSRMDRFPEAIDAFRKSDQSNPYVHIWLTCDYASLGREQDARAEAAQVLRLSPQFSLEGMRQRVPAIWRNPKRAQCLAELQKVGLK